MPKKKSIMVRFRHRQKLIKGSFLIRNNLVYLQYQPTLAVTIGQFAVLYDREICLGGGIVDKIC
jgi:tRNA-specific 2-thiouridylase